MRDETLSTKVNAALVFRGDFHEVDLVKNILIESGIEIIYQRIVPAGTKLYIKEGNNNE